tara:strand:- start:1307 stop:1417 length:111 start_codon:yes stop_codon:yes gene_type:complete
MQQIFIENGTTDPLSWQAKGIARAQVETELQRPLQR